MNIFCSIILVIVLSLEILAAPIMNNRCTRTFYLYNPSSSTYREGINNTRGGRVGIGVVVGMNSTVMSK